jgi:hypothetical protein
VARNGHTQYDSEVRFDNIRATANLSKVKGPPLVAGNGVVKGCLMANVPVTVTDNNEGSIAHAMKKRCDNAVNHDVEPEVFLAGHKIMMAKIHQRETIVVDSQLIKEYLALCTPSKAEKLTRAMQEDEWTLDGDNAQKHVFAKAEALLKEHGAQPRIVYQGTDMYNLLVGPVIMELQRRLQEELSRSNPLNHTHVVIYAPGLKKEELGEIVDDASGMPLENDFENNDGRQSGAWRKHEAMFYKKLGAPDWFVRTFAHCVSVRVWTRVGIEGTVVGQRWSGEGTTTPGNTYVGACIIQSGLAQVKVVMGYGSDFKSTNIHGGDDYAGVIAGVNESDSEKVKDVIVDVVARTGMKAKAFVPKSKTHMTFYRTRFVKHETKSRVPVPQFGRVLSKINVRANKNSNISDREYMAGKYLSAAYEHRYVPVVRDVLLMTSEQMSDAPFIESNDSRKFGGATVSGLRETIKTCRPLTYEKMESFCDTIYDTDFSSVVKTYERFAQSAIDYVDGWTEVRSGKYHNKANNHRYKPHLVDDDAAQCLVRVDC